MDNTEELPVEPVEPVETTERHVTDEPVETTERHVTDEPVHDDENMAGTVFSTPRMSELSLPGPAISGENFFPSAASATGDLLEDPDDGVSQHADVSRAGRKRKANSKYMDEPSPLIAPRPAPRRSTGGPKKAAPAAPTAAAAAAVHKATAPEPVQPDIPTGPPTFSQILFGKKTSGRGRGMSEDTFSLDEVEEVEEEEEIPELTDEDFEDPTVAATSAPRRSRKSSEDHQEKLPSVPDIPTEKKMLPGDYHSSSAAGPIAKISIASLGRVALVPPATSGNSVIFPNVIPKDPEGGEYAQFLIDRRPNYVPIMAELAGGGPLGLIASNPQYWLRDEVPKLSAYFKKKMFGESAVPSVVGSSRSATKAATVSGETSMTMRISEAERAERRRKKEEERRRLIEERNRRRERERLKQLYRQHWLALTKFPIEDNVLHSRKGIRRLGHPPVQCRQIAPPIVFWDCRLGEPGTLEIPVEIDEKTTGLLDEIFVIWNFFQQFGKLMSPAGGGDIDGIPEFTLPDLVESVMTKKLTPLITHVHETLLGILEPFFKYEISTMLSAEQQYESQLVKNRGRAKLFWPTFSEFRDFLCLGHSILVSNLANPRDDDDRAIQSTAWLWRSMYLAKAIVLLDPIDPRRDFLTSVSASFEETDFEHKWLFDLELNGEALMYESIKLVDRIRLLRLLLNKVLSLPWVKMLVDKFCDARIHIASEISYIEKEERKSNQKIALCQKLQSIIASAPVGEEAAATVPSITLPMTESELSAEIAFRDSLAEARRSACKFVDNQLAVRLESIGRDRFMNEYFQISSNRKIVFVRQQSVTHQNIIRYGVYDSLSNLELLIQSLDDRGVREHALKTELQKIKANLFSDLMQEGGVGSVVSVNKCEVDWLHPVDRYQAIRDVPVSISTGPSDESETILAPLAECVDVTKDSIEMIRAVWYGLPFKKKKRRTFKTVAPKKQAKTALAPTVVKREETDEPKVGGATAAAAAADEEDDDDMTIIEDAEDIGKDEDVKFEESVDDVPEEDDGEDDLPDLMETEDDTLAVSLLARRVDEKQAFFDSLIYLSDTISKCISNSLIAHHKIDETASTTSSILIQFHIKNGIDMFRQVGIPTTLVEVEKMLLMASSVLESSNDGADKIVEMTSKILEGLLAIDDVIHDEIARHSELANPIEIWPISGGEKHAWKKFIGTIREDVAASPVGEEAVSGAGAAEDSSTPDDDKIVIPVSSELSYECENCGKRFKYHILVGVHKLHPCKTRGRKPIPMEPVMEVIPVGTKNGMVAIEKVVLPQFPPPPSSRAAVAAAAAAAAAASAQPAVTEGEGAPTASGEYVCELCGKVFPHNQGLAVHQTRWCIPEQQAQLILTAQQAVGTAPGTASMTGETGAVTCGNCGKVFPTAQGLAIHQNRWCSGGSNLGGGDASATTVGPVVVEPPKTAHVEPIFRKDRVSEDDILRIEPSEEATAPVSGDEGDARQPGYTPACYSLSAVSIAVMWYSNKLRAALDKFTSEKVHHSRSSNNSKKK